MNTLAEYHNDKNIINELEVKIKECSNYKDRIKELEFELKSMTTKLKNEQDYKRNWRKKYKNLASKMILNKGQRALATISLLKGTDNPMKLIRIIAEKCFLSETYVHQLWYQS